MFTKVECPARLTINGVEYVRYDIASPTIPAAPKALRMMVESALLKAEADVTSLEAVVKTLNEWVSIVTRKLGDHLGSSLASVSLDMRVVIKPVGFGLGLQSLVVPSLRSTHHFQGVTKRSTALWAEGLIAEVMRSEGLMDCLRPSGSDGLSIPACAKKSPVPSPQDD